MQAKLVSALDTLFYFKHRQLLREGFEKIFEASLPQQAPLNFSLVSVVQYYVSGVFSSLRANFKADSPVVQLTAPWKQNSERSRCVGNFD